MRILLWQRPELPAHVDYLHFLFLFLGIGIKQNYPVLVVGCFFFNALFYSFSPEFLGVQHSL